ncbi:MAG: hypothetical protein E7146_05690 [Rikenellaceae bacterium]|nr:hypothetical protein [Rikenellaceae bacterium]
MGSSVQHRGIVERIVGDIVYVSVEQQSACAACHAKGICTEQGAKRTIEVRSNHASQYNVGDRVIVALLNNAMGFSSIIWGYMLPLVVLIVGLLLCKAIGLGDGPSAVISIVAVAIYYGAMYIFRNKIEKKIQFTIIKE